MKILLDYVFPVTAITPTAQASTAFLKQVCLVCAPGDGDAGTITACTTMSQVAALTENTDAQQFFNAGMAKVYILLADDLNLEEELDSVNDFWTLVISSDFDDADVGLTAATGTVTITSYANLIDAGFDTIDVAGVTFTAQAGAATLGTATFRAATSNDATAASLAAQINAHATSGAKVTATVLGAVVTITSQLTGTIGNSYELAYADNGTATIGATVTGAGTLTGGDGLEVGSFKGVVGLFSLDADVAATYAATENRVGFFAVTANKAKNMCYAFGKLLSNALNWTNQQYITMPYDETVDTLGEANGFFDDKVSFVLNDDEYGKRLALFACGGKAIIAPYIKRNLEIDLQSATLSFISGNQPTYTNKNAALLENKLQAVVDSYIAREWIEAGTVEVKLEQENFVGSVYIDIAEPNALWRVYAELRQTL